MCWVHTRTTFIVTLCLEPMATLQCGWSVLLTAAYCNVSPGAREWHDGLVSLFTRWRCCQVTPTTQDSWQFTVNPLCSGSGASTADVFILINPETLTQHHSVVAQRLVFIFVHVLRSCFFPLYCPSVVSVNIVGTVWNSEMSIFKVVLVVSCTRSRVLLFKVLHIWCKHLLGIKDFKWLTL